MLIVTNNHLFLSLAYGGHWEGCTKADDALWSQLLHDNLVCFLVTRECMRLVDDDKRMCSSQSIERTSIVSHRNVVIVTGEHLTVCQQRTVDQQDVNLVGVLTRTFHKVSHHRWEILSALLLLFLSFEHAYADLCIITKGVFEVCSRVCFIQECASTSLDRNARYGNDELVYAVELMQFKDGVSIDVCLSCTCFHLDVQA